jgi:hypothetical protein
VNNELERLWKDAVVTGFDILSWHLSGTAKESYENPVRKAPVSAKDSNWASEYKSVVLLLELPCCV